MVDWENEKVMDYFCRLGEFYLINQNKVKDKNDLLSENPITDRG